jgi:hypothetical protein
MLARAAGRPWARASGVFSITVESAGKRIYGAPVAYITHVNTDGGSLEPEFRRRSRRARHQPPLDATEDGVTNGLTCS